MSLLTLFGVIVIVGMLIFLMIVFLLPSEITPKRREKQKIPQPSELQKSLEDRTVRSEKHIETLKRQAEVLENQVKAKDKEISALGEKIKGFQEKLAQEKSWREKEQDLMDKRAKEVHQFKQERLKLEQSIDEEHGPRLRAENELKELKKEFEGVNAERRSLSTKTLGLEKSVAQLTSEAAELKKLNAKLKERNEAVEWIAKPQYDKLESLLREKEKELERLKRQGDQPDSRPA